MKYFVYAKILGSYLPENKIKIGECTIKKNLFQSDDDRPTIPLRSKDLEFFNISKGIKNYIVHSQDLISTRTFESEYVIFTSVDTYNEYEALRISHERFKDVINILSLVAKNKLVKLGEKRIRREDETYDFEIYALYIKVKRQLVRLKLPPYLTSIMSFFPRPFPRKFISKAKKYLSFNDAIFRKGLIYYQRATAMGILGTFSELEIILNCVKCIELICYYIAKDELKLNDKKQKEMGEKEIIKKAGKILRVRTNIIKYAQELWETRCKDDVAHKVLHYNPYSKQSTNALISYSNAEAMAAEFLAKYYEYKIKNNNPITFYFN